ncbi:hypothetical protein PQR21_27725 [Paraburkholderia nemoris]|uniref:hypothetical protein n=1 Tax=Paraburkholderia nemoris TaxID=2793076 RepID=UPI0038B93304
MASSYALNYYARSARLRMTLRRMVFYTSCEDAMTSDFEATVVPAGESAGQFDVTCNYVRNVTQARCAAVIVIDGESGSGYSVVGPLEAQILLPAILRKMADTLHGQLSKNLQ